MVLTVSAHLREFCWKFLKSCADVGSIKTGLPLSQCAWWILEVPGRQTCADVFLGVPFVQTLV